MLLSGGKELKYKYKSPLTLIINLKCIRKELANSISCSYFILLAVCFFPYFSLNKIYNYYGIRMSKEKCSHQNFLVSRKNAGISSKIAHISTQFSKAET